MSSSDVCPKRSCKQSERFSPWQEGDAVIGADRTDNWRNKKNKMEYMKNYREKEQANKENNDQKIK